MAPHSGVVGTLPINNLKPIGNEIEQSIQYTNDNYKGAKS